MRDERDLPWLAGPLAALRDAERGHALILHGGVGSGRLELALRLAQTWLCEQAPRPCGACPSCHLVIAHTHPDLKVLLPETWQQRLHWHGDDGDSGAGSGDGEARSSSKKPSKDIKVDAVRQAIDWAHTSSGRGRGKVLLLFPADAMNQVAANALLKTLEEPALGMRLLLCVGDPERLLPTLRSRCQRFALHPPSAAEAERWLASQGVAGAAQLLQAAGGEPLAAQELAAAGIDASLWASLPALVAAGDARLLAGWPVPQAVRVLQQICHDAMARAAGGSPRYFPAASLPVPAAWPALLAWSRSLQEVARHDEHPWSAGLLIESLVGQGQRALLASARSAPEDASGARSGTGLAARPRSSR